MHSAAGSRVLSLCSQHSNVAFWIYPCITNITSASQCLQAILQPSVLCARIEGVELEKGKEKHRKLPFFLHLIFYTLTVLMVKADVMHSHRNTNAVRQRIFTILHKNKTRGGR